MVNVTIYSIHGSYGYQKNCHRSWVFWDNVPWITGSPKPSDVAFWASPTGDVPRRGRGSHRLAWPPTWTSTGLVWTNSMSDFTKNAGFAYEKMAFNII